MSQMTDVDFKVRWLPFELNSASSKAGVNKMEMYMKKFNMTREKCIGMADWMKGNFAAVGLGYKFTEHGLTGNTFNSHRLIAWAESKGKQDAVVEELFRNYFTEEKFINDPEVLVAAAKKAGIAEAEARAFVEDEGRYAAETRAEFGVGQELKVTGVPFFDIVVDGKRVGLSGAQPEEKFLDAFRQLAC